MPNNPLERRAPWKQIVGVAVLVPVIIGLALTSFAWTTARTAPRDLPVGVVASGPARANLDTALARAGFEVHHYGDRAAATRAIEHRDTYAAILAGGGATTVLTASAASPVVANAIAQEAPELASGPVTVVDAVPLSKDDPRGAVFAASILPLIIGGMIVASLVGLVLALRPAWRSLVALVTVSATTGLVAYAIAQWWLGALPGEPLATWAALSLTILAIGTTVVGLLELIGVAGIGVGSALMIFVGNPFAGTTSAPDLLPTWVRIVGQLLPPGAGANLVRSTAYFHGYGAGEHVLVLVCWVLLGTGAIVLGHRLQARRAGGPAHAEPVGRHELDGEHVPFADLAAAR